MPILTTIIGGKKMKINKLKIDLNDKETVESVAIFLEGYTLEDIEKLKTLVDKNIRIVSSK